MHEEHLLRAAGGNTVVMLTGGAFFARLKSNRLQSIAKAATASNNANWSPAQTHWPSESVRHFRCKLVGMLNESCAILECVVLYQDQRGNKTSIVKVGGGASLQSQLMIRG